MADKRHDAIVNWLEISQQKERKCSVYNQLLNKIIVWDVAKCGVHCDAR
jgi:hypothetical protein